MNTKDIHLNNIKKMFGNCISSSQLPSHLNSSEYSESYVIANLPMIANLRLFILLSPKFPTLSPNIFLSFVSGNILSCSSFANILDKQGLIKQECMPLWNFRSSLDRHLEEIVKKLAIIHNEVFCNMNNVNSGNNNMNQGRQGNNNSHGYSNSGNMNAFNSGGVKNISSNMNAISSNNNSVNRNEKLNVLEENEFKSKIESDLGNRSLEELLLISNNVNNYVDYLFVEQDSKNLEMCNQILTLKEEYQKLQSEYNESQEKVNYLLKDYENNEAKINELLSLNDKSLSKFDLKNFICELDTMIEEQLNKPRNILINELSKGNMNFDSFSKNNENFQKFRELGINYHKFSMIRDKLKHKLMIQEKMNSLSN
mmetsp:Transcript_9455/g.9785  ORF Transcript_9455/g.9785 Transcript_9455/m.9785 type:complete len:369 (-) Transcript_9455:45-1151(-)